MEPGSELDTAVAEKVMGLHKVVEPAGFGPGEWDVWRSPDGGKASESGPPRYSTDIAAAFQVLEKVRETCHIALDSRDHGDGLGRWFASISRKGAGPQFGVRHIGKTAPHAICLVALESVGVSVPRARQ